MKPFKELKNLDLPSIDQTVSKYWEDRHIFKKSVDQRPAEEKFVFFEGPPSANGKPGIHHVMSRTVKDLFCRFQSMNGKRVERKGGWDTHGLPIELSVEKELGITKEDIGIKISVDEYNDKCKETVMQYKDLWDDVTKQMGYWVDLDNPYITFDQNYIESVFFLIKRLYDKGLLYKGYTIQPFSPAAGTGLSSHELNQPGCYREVKDTSAVAQFKLVQDTKTQFLFDAKGEGDVFALAWTTTPWTLPSNTALAVGEDIDYVLIATRNPYTKLPVNVILAEDLVSSWFKSEQFEADLNSWSEDQKIIPAKRLLSFKGAALELASYEQLLPYVQPEEGDAFKVLCGDFVSTSDGTGIVHIAPSFGADDMKVAKKYGVGALTLVDKQGKFVDAVTDFAGRYVKDYKDEGESYRNVDVDISIKLKEENRAFNVQKYSHNYPHCWRTDKPILYYPLDSWFIRTTSLKDRMVELNNTINWKPASTGEKRFGNWLENIQDWNLSRSRYWGIPLPIWRTDDGTAEKCIGSYEELKNEISIANQKLGLNQDFPKDIHRPYIDEVILVSEDGRPMRRELDLIDVWFDSGSMPYAQWHYPFENKEKIDGGNAFPADFIAEGVDQTRGWFYTLHAIAVMAFDSVAFKNVVSNGLVLDKNGVKMSKRLGNVIDPFETIKLHGADATRWYMIANAPPWDNLKFDMEGVEEVKRKFFGTLFNTYSFFNLYASVDGFINQYPQVALKDRPELDRWILSSLNTLVKDVRQAYEEYEPTTAARRIQEFTDSLLSNWYVRLSRRRFWKGDMSAEKVSAYQTLYECLTTISQLSAPIAPFFSDWLYVNLTTGTEGAHAESVHLSDFPQADLSMIDAALENRMDLAQRITSLVLSIRKKENLRVRLPLNEVMIPILKEETQNAIDAVSDIIKAEVNVKMIKCIKDEDGLITKSAKANFKTLGKRMGKDMKAAAEAISTFDQVAISSLEQSGTSELVLNGTIYSIGLEDVEITFNDIPGWQVAVDGDLTVALDTNVTDELKKEGLAREFVNRIQGLRKAADLELTSRIEIYYEASDYIKEVIALHNFYITEETLADAIIFEANMDGESIELADSYDTKLKIAEISK